MNKGLLLALLALVFGASAVNAQLTMKNKWSWHFVLPDFQMTLSANFLTGGYPYNPTYVTLPFKEEHFTVYGQQVILSAFKRDSLINIGDHGGSFLMDTSLQDQHAFPLEHLQARVFRNDSLLSGWQYIEKMPSFKDTSVTYKAAPHLPANSYWLVNDNMQVNDSMLIELRRDTATPFLRLHLKREDGNIQPLMMSSANNKTVTELSFISKELLNQQDLIKSTPFYHDRPGGGLDYNNALLSTDDQLSFHFRNNSTKANDSIFLYRLTGGRYKDTAWQKSAGLIFLTGLTNNAHYRLEVKYADGYGKSSLYTFYTAPLWYQTTWFKVTVLAMVIALLLLFSFMSRTRKNKRRIKYLQLEMQALHAQMNPHFLFNALSSIQGLMNDQQTDKANKYLSGFAALLRSAVSQGRKELVALSVELKDLNNYIELERLRFGFRYELDILPGLPADEITILPLLAQPLIENAAKHGLSGKRENGLLTLQIMREQSDLLLYVTDNGNGFNPNNGGSGHGIALTRERIALFNRMYKHRKIILDISSSASGTRCCFRFKNWLDND